MEYVRVSAVLAQLQDFSHIPEGILAAKQVIGTNVHAAIKDIIDGQFPILENPREPGYVKSFCQWRDAAKPAFTLTETRYYDDAKMLTGQIDALVILEGKEDSILVDFKTSVQENAYIWPLQAHLYHYLMTQNNICNLSNKFIFLKLCPKGKMPKVCEYEYSSDKMDFAKSLVDMYWEKQKVIAANDA